MKLVFPILIAAAPLAADLHAQQARDTLPVTVAEKQIAAFNARDLDAFMALYADDANIYEFPSGKLVTQGKAAIRERFAALMKTSLPEVRVEPRIVNGQFVVENEVCNAKPGERNQAVWMYEIKGGLIVRSWRMMR
mgnify:CR=1 FL=1